MPEPRAMRMRTSTRPNRCCVCEYTSAPLYGFASALLAKQQALANASTATPYFVTVLGVESRCRGNDIARYIRVRLGRCKPVTPVHESFSPSRPRAKNKAECVRRSGIQSGPREPNPKKCKVDGPPNASDQRRSEERRAGKESKSRRSRG